MLRCVGIDAAARRASLRRRRRENSLSRAALFFSRSARSAVHTARRVSGSLSEVAALLQPRLQGLDLRSRNLELLVLPPEKRAVPLLLAHHLGADLGCMVRLLLLEKLRIAAPERAVRRRGALLC